MCVCVCACVRVAGSIDALPSCCACASVYVRVRVTVRNRVIYVRPYVARIHFMRNCDDTVCSVRDRKFYGDLKMHLRTYDSLSPHP